MNDKRRRQCEVLTGAVLTLWIVALHLINLFQAGPLWRDECDSVDFAAMRSVGEIWHNLRYDISPPLFVAVVRVWTWAGLTSDFDYRVLGFLIGMGTLGILWFCARRMGGHAPLLVLALYAANPLAIRVGDSLRPYGLGIALTFLSMTLIWSFARNPGKRAFWWATLAATLSVQCLYQNAFFVLASCCGAWAMTVGRKDWKNTVRVGMIGMIAALSLLPYWAIISEGQMAVGFRRRTISFDTVWEPFQSALQASGARMVPVWIVLCGGGLAVAGFYGIRQRRPNMIYSGMVMFGSAALYLIFLRVLGLPPHVWYFLILMGSGALMLDAILTGIDLPRWQVGRMRLSILLVVLCLPVCYAGVRLRQSNIDLVAAKLKESVQPGDAVVVAPWYYGVALQRYFDASRWTTLPPLQDQRIHRYDLLKQAMMMENPIGPVMDKMRSALSSGRNVWLVGTVREMPGGGRPPFFPPYTGNMEEAEGAYCTSWEYQVIYWMKNHGARASWVPVPLPDGQALNSLEDVRLALVQGWKP